MKKVLWIILFLTTTLSFAQDNKNFVYNEHGKKDPFGPLVSSTGAVISYDTDMSATDLILEGVIGDAKGNNLALINGKVVKPGDQVGLYTIDSIGNDHVDLIKGQEHLTVKLKKGGI
jgi:hypothetical protein